MWWWRSAKVKGCQIPDRMIVLGRRWVSRLECPGQDIALKMRWCWSVKCRQLVSQLVTVSSIRVVALAATFSEWLLWGEVGGKADHPYQAKAQSSFLTNPAPPPLLVLTHSRHPSSPCIRMKTSCRHPRERSFPSVCHTWPEVSQSGLRVPAEPRRQVRSRWALKPWNATS